DRIGTEDRVDAGQLGPKEIAADLAEKEPGTIDIHLVAGVRQRCGPAEPGIEDGAAETGGNIDRLLVVLRGLAADSADFVRRKDALGVDQGIEVWVVEVAALPELGGSG